MIVKGIGATTQIDRHNCRITKEALESASEQINNSESVPSVGLHHDITIMPIGKLISAEVLPMGNSEYKMEITQEIFDKDYIIELNDGTKLIMNKSSFDDRPFTEDEDDYNNVKVSIDHVNFENNDDFILMQNLIEEHNALNGVIARKSYIPDPEIIIQVGSNIATYLIGKKIIDSVGDRVLNNVLDEVDKFYSLIKAVILKYSKLAIPKNRPQTYVFKLIENCNVELVIVTKSPNEVFEAISGEKLSNIIEKLDDLRLHFRPKRIQFVYEDGSWLFNYLCTEKGEVIGTELSYKKRVKALDLLKNESERINVSIEG